MKQSTYGVASPNLTYAVMDPTQITTTQEKDLDVRTDSTMEIRAHCSVAENKLYPQKYALLRIIWKGIETKAETITMLLYKSILHVIPSPRAELKKVE